MRKFKQKLQNPFIRSTWNVMLVQATFVLLTIIVFGFAVWHQQHTTQMLINQGRIESSIDTHLNQQTLDTELHSLRDNTLIIALGVLAVLALIFGYLTARYALNPTRRSLEFQKRFIGDIAHELRTPLAIIRTNTEVALMDRTLEGYARSTMQGTIEELDRISGIINNLLSFDSLVQPGRIKVEPLLLRDIANAVVHRHLAMAEKYGINIGVDVAQAPAYVMGNQIALEQAVTNLVKNALNYTPQHQNQSVVVRIDDKGDAVSLSIIDTGIGIAQKDLFNIFQPFYRGDTSRERGIGSGTSGLGLAIVNDIVRAHSGHITIRSALNRGTTIELSFPKVASPTAPNEQLPERPEDADEHEERIA